MLSIMGLRGLGECNANPVVPEWAAVTVPTLTAAAGPATAGAAVLATPAPGFDYSAAGVSYQGVPVVSWAQLALGWLALRGSG